MPQIDFSGSRRKVQRANRHIDDLKSLINAFIETDFCELRVQPNPKTGGDDLQVVALVPLPCDIPLVVGDAVHALRVAIDYPITTLFPQHERWIGFPIAKRRDDVISTKSYRPIKKSRPDIADFIIDEVKPYIGGNCGIWELSELDNMDKHRLILPVASVQSITCDAANEHGLRIVDCLLTATNIPANATGGTTLISGKSGLKIQKYGKPTLEIVFPEGPVFAGEPILETLTQISNVISEIVDAIETLALGNIADPNP